MCERIGVTICISHIKSMYSSLFVPIINSSKIKDSFAMEDGGMGGWGDGDGSGEVEMGRRYFDRIP